MRRRLIQIAFKGLLIRNRGNKFFLMSIALLMFIPTVLYTASQDIMNGVEYSHKKVFGSFTDIYYDSKNTNKPSISFTESNMRSILNDFHYLQYGVFYTTYEQQLANDKIMYLGYADDTALSLANVTLVQGKLPSNSNEIALTQSIAALLGDKRMDTSVTIAGATYTISSIIEDFGYIWPKGQSQIDMKTNPVNAFITLEEANRVLTISGQVSKQILIVREQGVSNSIENSDNFYSNVNNSIENQKKFTIPVEFRILIYIASIIIIAMVLSLIRHRLIERVKNYYLTGITKSEIVFIIWAELFFLTIAGLLIGFIIGCAVTFLFLKRNFQPKI